VNKKTRSSAVLFGIILAIIDRFSKLLDYCICMQQNPCYISNRTLSVSLYLYRLRG